MVDITKVRPKLEKAALDCCEITAVELVERGDVPVIPGMAMKDVPEHVRVCVTARPEPESNIKIELWLPTENWNGDLAGIGNGGSAGMILPMMLVNPLRLGFASVTTDLGTSAGPDCGIGNQAVWADFGHRATHVMTVLAKELVKAYYGTPAKYAYFYGGSTGGQQAFSEAQRYPEDYDGILACAPAYDRVKLHLAFLWDWLALNGPDVEPITREMEGRIVNAFLEQCGNAGEKRGGDAFFYRPDRIKVTEDMLCGLGLTQPQLDGLMKVYGGLAGIYEPTLVPGSEACDLGLAHRCERDTFAQSYFYIFRWVLGADFDFTGFDFERHGKLVRDALSEHLDAVNPDLSAFHSRGGKLLLVHGTADPIIPMTSSIRYFETVQKTMGNTADFFRLFLLPGMGHISGGPGVQDFVYGMPATPRDERHLGLLTLKAWVEDGKAPDILYPVAFKTDDPLSAFQQGGVAWEREIAPYYLERTAGHNGA